MEFGAIAFQAAFMIALRDPEVNGSRVSLQKVMNRALFAFWW
jgi:hypothetical protein